MPSAPNTPTNSYISAFQSSDLCSDSKDEMDKACKEEPANPPEKSVADGQAKLQSMDNAGSTLGALTDKNKWLQHCTGLLARPTESNSELFNNPDLAATMMLQQFKVDKLANSNKKTPAYQNYTREQMNGAADTQKELARMNPCISARRCSLMPYKDTKNADDAAESGDGCCPGQTGHHVIPSSMFKGCSAYKSGEGATICVEGVNNSHGSHGAIHGAMEELMALHWAKTPEGLEDKITNTQAIEAGAKSVEMVFPGCDKKCIEAQLTKHYENLCKDKLKPRDGKGGATSESPVPLGEITQAD